MNCYCLKCKKDTEKKSKSCTNGKTMLLSNWAKCGSKKSRFIKNQDTKGILSNLGIRKPLRKVPLSGHVLF